jgi:fluoride ion exporter CrcB/FEX
MSEDVFLSLLFWKVLLSFIIPGIIGLSVFNTETVTFIISGIIGEFTFMSVFILRVWRMPRRINYGKSGVNNVDNEY